MFGGEKPREPREPRLDRASASRIQVASAPEATVASPALRPSATTATPGVALPATATDSELRMMLGLLLCAASLALAVVGRRRAAA